MGRNWPDKDIKLIIGLSGGLCAFPGCRQPCFEPAVNGLDPVVIGEIAHMFAHSNGGPRANPDLPVDLRDCYDNGILFCRNCHKVVDSRANGYAVSDLKRWKEEHERWYRTSIAAEMPAVSFAELEIVAKALLVRSSLPIGDLTVTDPREKMRRNELVKEETHFFLTWGIVKSTEVRQFLEDIARIHPDFPEDLKAGFVARYQELREEGYRGDALFEGLREMVCGVSKEFKYHAAGLAVLCYLFEKCEVFEK